MAIAGRLGVICDLGKVPNPGLPVEKVMYSETQGRFIVTVPINDREEFESQVVCFDFGKIGHVTEKDFIVNCDDQEIIYSSIEDLEKIYKKRFGEF